jgi:hypothetical protein
MAMIGDSCRSTQDCNAGALIDTGLTCVNGQCVDSSAGGGTISGGGGGGTTGTSSGTGGSSSGTSNSAPSLFLALATPAVGLRTVSAGGTGTFNFLLNKSPAATSPFEANIVVDKIEKLTAAGIERISSGITTNFTNTSIVQSGETKIQSVLNFSTLSTLAPATYRVYVRAFIPVSVSQQSTQNLPSTRGDCSTNEDCGADRLYYCDTSIATGFRNGDVTDPLYVCRLNPQARSDTTITPTSTLTVDIVISAPAPRLDVSGPVTVFINNSATTTATVTRNGNSADLLVRAGNLPTGVTANELELNSNNSTGTLRFTAANNATRNEQGIDVPVNLVLKSDPNTIVASTTVRLIIRTDVCANGPCTQNSNCTNGRICQNGCCVDPPLPPDNTTVQFTPAPNTALSFAYTRNSNIFPSETVIVARNPSSTKTFTVVLRALQGTTLVSAGQNPAITITPAQLILQPGRSGSFSIRAVGQYLQSLNVGTYQDIRIDASISDT